MWYHPVRMLVCVVLLIGHRALAGDVVDPACIKDSTKEPNGDNLQTCPTEGENTKCCVVKEAWGCCPPDEAPEDMNLIYIILGCLTGGLMVVIFFWKCCNTKSMPCLIKVHERAKKCCPCLDKDAQPKLAMPKELQRTEFTDADFFGNPAVIHTVAPPKELQGMERNLGKISLAKIATAAPGASHAVPANEALGSNAHPTELPPSANAYDGMDMADTVDETDAQAIAENARKHHLLE